MYTRKYSRTRVFALARSSRAPYDCHKIFYGQDTRSSYLIYELGVREVVHRRVTIDRGTRRTGFYWIPVHAAAAATRDGIEQRTGQFLPSSRS